MSQAITEDIQVNVDTHFLPERSDPSQGLWLYVYHVTITNQSANEVQLMSRHWIITNGNGIVQNVQGAGVVGQQPRMRPGEGFQYVSACPLDTAVGTMHGTYQMITDGGEEFDAEVPMFVLADPQALN